MIDHLSLQIADVVRSRAFYATLLAPLGLRAAFTNGIAVASLTTGCTALDRSDGGGPRP